MATRGPAIILCVLVLIGTVNATAQSDGAAEPSLEGTVQIGALVPITGDGSVHGQDIRLTLELAESEINQYLQEQGAKWELDIMMEDSASNPVIALEKLTAIKAHGIDLVVGTYSSAELRNLMGYATSNNMLMISYGSIAQSLAVSGDKIFRFIPNATTQAPVNAQLFNDMGVTHVIPVWRGDAWGDDLVKATTSEFEMLGGTVSDGIRYNPEAVEFSTEIALLSDQVKRLAADVDRGNIGILLLTFSEGVDIAQAAYQYESLYGIKWVGSDTLFNVGGPGSDRISSEFFDSQLSVTFFAAPENEVRDRVVEHMVEKTGRIPIVYSLTAYDAAWAIARSIQAADSTDSDSVTAALLDVLEDEYRGIFGKIVLNDAGDLDISTYEISQLKDNEWISTGVYNSESGSIAWSQDIITPSSDGPDPGTGAESSSPGYNDGGCLIATAAFGSELAPQVQFLREVRSSILQTDSGASFMDGFSAFYYSFSPAVADLERQSPELRWLVKTAATPALYILGIMSAADPDSEASVVSLGVMTMLALAGVYVAAPACAISWTVGRIGKGMRKI